MTTNDIRKLCSRRSAREPCFICGEHEDITQAHHVMPLSKVKIFLEQGHFIEEPPIVWLCSNCHTRVHRFYEESIHKTPEFTKRYFEMQEMEWKYFDGQAKRWLSECCDNSPREPS